MVKCPKCGTNVPKSVKDWNYGIFHVNMYKCDCGNQFREYFHERKLKFVLSAHNGSLGTRKRKQKSQKKSMS